MLNTIFMLVQLFFTMVIGVYFFTMLKSRESNRASIEKDSKNELEKLNKMKEIKLTLPLSEKTRPTDFSQIIGQEQGLKALKAALCGSNPQHVIIYGPPGIGKTAASRLVLEEAKKMEISPFKYDAKFIETDASTMRFDERNIADPLIGSVHDPIYQGAGSYGPAGIPQPKPGAVSKAHGGILFIDEIGELHPIQMNRLLKVLEDRKVFFESAYYSSGNKSIPPHIHDIFQNGLPADFRLVGATTRSPEEIPEAIRSRCVEIYFKSLNSEEIRTIAKNAASQGSFKLEEGADEIVAHYAANGRDAVNIIQTSGSVSLIHNSNLITKKNIEWVIEVGKYSPRFDKKLASGSSVGVVNGLAVWGSSSGSVLEIEAVAEKSSTNKGTVTVTGIVEHEEIESRGQRLSRTSSIKSSVENMFTLMNKHFSINTKNYNLHINFPNSPAVDGPSAGIAIVAAVYSAIKGKPVNHKIALTGEISIKGRVCPVGGVPAKIEAALLAGAEKVIIPKDNWQEQFVKFPIKIITVDNIDQVIELVFNDNSEIEISQRSTVSQKIDFLTAEPLKNT